MMIFDPRAISVPVHNVLQALYDRTQADEKRLKQQKNQAVELYTYLSTWGLLRLKAEEAAISQDQAGKRQVVQAFFDCLQQLAQIDSLTGELGLETLKTIDTEAYLGLTGLALRLAQEFSFWATAVYRDVTLED